MFPGSISSFTCEQLLLLKDLLSILSTLLPFAAKPVINKLELNLIPCESNPD